MSGCGAECSGLVDLLVISQRLDLTFLEVFSNQSDSVILWYLLTVDHEDELGLKTGKEENPVATVYQSGSSNAKFKKNLQKCHQESEKRSKSSAIHLKKSYWFDWWAFHFSRILLKISTGDLEEETECTSPSLRTLTKPENVTDTLNETDSTQEHLNKLQEWVTMSLMVFSNCKCGVLHLGWVVDLYQYSLEACLKETLSSLACSGQGVRPETSWSPLPPE
ncbi:hypothetical protein BTVI_37091 [Pitangus sulphuratus]|nr:hypothetical protein BTVI_37091 [Pitangus sulphuratus]